LTQEKTEELTENQLKAACHERGISTVERPREVLTKNLQNWIELGSKPVPPSAYAFALLLKHNVYNK
jgi:hypothetical protein